MNEFCIIIPAVKKSVAFPDDLVRKLHGASLIQRTIDKAKEVTGNGDIFVVTDSEEITLICERNRINCFCKKDLRLNNYDIISNLKFFILKIYKCYKNIIVLWPYTPLLSKSEILRAYHEFNAGKSDVLITLREEGHRIYKKKDRSLQSLILDEHREKVFTEMRSFLILRTSLIPNTSLRDLKIQPFVLGADELEIKNYQDWWICEKLLQRKRIVFRVIGNERVGMGHIYRSLTLAREITDHEIIFICDDKSHLIVNKVAGYDYRIETAGKQEIEEKTLALKPDMVIMDVLSTTREQVQRLKKNNIKVISFEDLGSGAKGTDLTINELYDEPQMEGENIKWGHKYFFVRDEFNDAKPHKFRNNVENLLITFGGTDPNNLTLKILGAVEEFCRSEHITIHVVTGSGYLHKENLLRHIGESRAKIEFTSATGVISKIMGKAQLAITSNGRTVYELVHMNIPALVVSHHERENTHLFSTEGNGLINLGVYREGISERLIIKGLKKLVLDATYRRNLFENTRKYNFAKNKRKVVTMITRLLN